MTNLLILIIIRLYILYFIDFVMFSESFENHFDYEEDEEKQDEWTEWKWKPFGEKENQQENKRIWNDKDELWKMKKQADEHPQNWPITDWKSAIKTIWESLKGEGYESKNSFSTKWKNWEDINVEYKKDWTIHTSIQINNENLEITLSWYEKQEWENNQKEKNESPINVSYSGNMSAKNLQNLFWNKNINSIQDLTPQQWIDLIKWIQKHEIQNVHGTVVANAKKQTQADEKERQKEKQAQADEEEGQKEKEELAQIHDQEILAEQETKQKLAELEKEIIESYTSSIWTEDWIEQPNMA